MLFGRPSSDPPPASISNDAVLSSMSTPPSADNSYVGSSEGAPIGTVTPVRPEPSMKQQLTATMSLPVEVLINCFQRIEPKQVHTLAVVCSSWRTAAAAATSSISVQFHQYCGGHFHTTAKADSLRHWLRNNASGVKELSLSSHWHGTLALPLAELRQLQVLTLKNLDIAQWDGSLNPTLAASNGLSLLTSLTKLSLDQYPITTSLNMLSALTQLREMNWIPACLVRAQRFADPKIDCKGNISAAALKQLTGLTSLRLNPGAVEHRATGIISKLSKLQKLDYICESIQQASQLAGLPGSLTHFKVTWGGGPLLTKALAPDLAKLTTLQHLELSGEVALLNLSYISPCVVKDMTQLTYLALSGLYGALMPLLSVVGGLCELRHLHLWDNTAVDMQSARQDCCQFSLLTASSHLTHLDLYFTAEQFPNNVGDYIFPENRQLPNLQILKLGQDPVGDDGFYLEILDPPVLARIVRKCPAIEELSLVRAVDVSADELVATQLSGLTQLAIGGWVLRDSTIKGLLPRLTKLRDLTLWDTNMTDVGALEMTQLTELTRLKMSNSKTSGGFMEHGVDLKYHEKRPIPVWQQLQTACGRSAKCAKLLLERAEAV